MTNALSIGLVVIFVASLIGIRLAYLRTAPKERRSVVLLGPANGHRVGQRVITVPGNLGREQAEAIRQRFCAPLWAAGIITPGRITQADLYELGLAGWTTTELEVLGIADTDRWIAETDRVLGNA